MPAFLLSNGSSFNWLSLPQLGAGCHHLPRFRTSIACLRCSGLCLSAVTATYSGGKGTVRHAFGQSKQSLRARHANGHSQAVLCSLWNVRVPLSSRNICVGLIASDEFQTLSIRGQVFAQNLNFSPKSTFFWICKIPDSVGTSKSNFKSKFCWHGRQGPRASKKEFRSFQKTKSKFLKSPKIPEFVSEIPILG